MEPGNPKNKKSQSLGKIVVETNITPDELDQKANFETATTVNTKSKKSNSSRYKSLLKALGDTVKKRKEEKENAKLNQGKKVERLKANLGLNKIKPKILDKTKKNDVTLPKINLNSNRPFSTNETQLMNRKPAIKIDIEEKAMINEKDDVRLILIKDYLEKPKTSSQVMVEKQKRYKSIEKE